MYIEQQNQRKAFKLAVHKDKGFGNTFELNQNNNNKKTFPMLTSSKSTHLPLLFKKMVVVIQLLKVSKKKSSYAGTPQYESVLKNCEQFNAKI